MAQTQKYDFAKYSDANAAINSARQLKPVAQTATPFKGMETYLMAFEASSHKMEAYFTVLPDGNISIRTFNWRAENEVCAVYSAVDAREFYRRLLRAGYTRQQYPATKPA